MYNGKTEVLPLKHKGRVQNGMDFFAPIYYYVLLSF